MYLWFKHEEIFTRNENVTLVGTKVVLHVCISNHKMYNNHEDHQFQNTNKKYKPTSIGTNFFFHHNLWTIIYRYKNRKKKNEIIMQSEKTTRKKYSFFQLTIERVN